MVDLALLQIHTHMTPQMFEIPMTQNGGQLDGRTRATFTSFCNLHRGSTMGKTTKLEQHLHCIKYVQCTSESDKQFFLIHFVQRCISLCAVYYFCFESLQPHVKRSFKKEKDILPFNWSRWIRAPIILQRFQYVSTKDSS